MGNDKYTPTAKYVPVRRISLDHIEVRIFNSSFNSFYVTQKIQESKKIIEDFLVDTIEKLKYSGRGRQLIYT